VDSEGITPLAPSPPCAAMAGSVTVVMESPTGAGCMVAAISAGVGCLESVLLGIGTGTSERPAPLPTCAAMAGTAPSLTGAGCMAGGMVCIGAGAGCLTSGLFGRRAATATNGLAPPPPCAAMGGTTPSLTDGGTSGMACIGTGAGCLTSGAVGDVAGIITIGPAAPPPCPGTADAGAAMASTTGVGYGIGASG